MNEKSRLHNCALKVAKVCGKAKNGVSQESELILKSRI